MTIDTNTPPTKTQVRWADFLERVLWTLVQVATGTGLVEGYQALPAPNIPPLYVPLVLIIVTALLAALKNALAQKFGNGTGATLPEQLESVPPEDVLVQQTAAGLAVAGQGYVEGADGEDIPPGTPVDITSVAPDQDTPEDLGDDVALNLEPPVGFDDGTAGV